MAQSIYLSGLFVLPMMSQPKLMKSSLNWLFFGGHLSKAKPSSLMTKSWSSTLEIKSSLIDYRQMVVATLMISEGKYLMMDFKKIGCFLFVEYKAQMSLKVDLSAW